MAKNVHIFSVLAAIALMASIVGCGRPLVEHIDLRKSVDAEEKLKSWSSGKKQDGIFAVWGPILEDSKTKNAGKVTMKALLEIEKEQVSLIVLCAVKPTDGEARFIEARSTSPARITATKVRILKPLAAQEVHGESGCSGEFRIKEFSYEILMGAHARFTAQGAGAINVFAH